MIMGIAVSELGRKFALYKGIYIMSYTESNIISIYYKLYTCCVYVVPPTSPTPPPVRDNSTSGTSTGHSKVTIYSYNSILHLQCIYRTTYVAT